MRLANPLSYIINIVATGVVARFGLVCLGLTGFRTSYWYQVAITKRYTKRSFAFCRHISHQLKTLLLTAFKLI